MLRDQLNGAISTELLQLAFATLTASSRQNKNKKQNSFTAYSKLRMVSIKFPQSIHIFETYTRCMQNTVPFNKNVNNISQFPL